MQSGLLLLLFLIHCIFATPAPYNRIDNHACVTDSDCPARLVNSICYNERCICQFGYASNGCRLEKIQTRDRRQTNYGKKRIEILSNHANSNSA